ncbi:MAG: sigma-70 family RNA polymerase sigma factor [Gemmataceae bacterium]
MSIYTPLLHSWLRRYEVLSKADVDDLTQEVLLAVAKEVSEFRHDRKPGAFRGWLRAILVNRLRGFWRSRHHRPPAVGGSDFLHRLEQLGDDASEVSRFWDREHDRQVMHRLLGLVRADFEARTWQAFHRQFLDGVPAAEVARELDLPLHSVYAAKSRVLRALRAAAAGLVS